MAVGISIVVLLALRIEKNDLRSLKFKRVWYWVGSEQSTLFFKKPSRELPFLYEFWNVSSAQFPRTPVWENYNIKISSHKNSHRFLEVIPSVARLLSVADILQRNSILKFVKVVARQFKVRIRQCLKRETRDYSATVHLPLTPAPTPAPTPIY